MEKMGAGGKRRLRPAGVLPVAWYLMNNWLWNFAYRVGIGWWVFLFAGGVALLIALLIVSYRIIKAAQANPVDSLRYE
jgi:putative ABC transport system permease protein